MPRPNWAGRPVTVRSVITRTAVRSPSAASVAVTVAAAVPADRMSFPVASTTIRWAASSRSTKRPFPWYVSAIGPSFTFTVPVNVSSCTLVRVAPGIHGAILGRSSRTAQAEATGTGTVKLCSSRMGRPFLFEGRQDRLFGQPPPRVAAIPGGRRRVAGRVCAVGGVGGRGRHGRRVGRYPGQRRLDRFGAHRPRTHVGQDHPGLCDGAVVAAHRCRDPDQRPCLGHPAELLVVAEPAVLFGHPDRYQPLAGLDGGGGGVG